MKFLNKVVLITGASSGIGADAARHLAKLSGNIVLCGRNEARLKEVVKQIKDENSPTPLAIVSDVNTDADRIMDETIKHFGKLDVLVNNAGFGEIAEIRDANIESFDRVFNTNLRSVVVLTKLALPHLEKTKGNIVNVSSLCSMVVGKKTPYYNMTKAALDQFTKCAALEFAEKGIRVNSINPGIIDTPIFINLLKSERLEKFFENISENYPLQRVGKVSDTSSAIEYLASDDASFVTGIQLRIDGGALLNGLH